eukprot:Awhi_evm2s15684
MLGGGFTSFKRLYPDLCVEDQTPVEKANNSAAQRLPVKSMSSSKNATQSNQNKDLSIIRPLFGNVKKQSLSLGSSHNIANLTLPSQSPNKSIPSKHLPKGNSGLGITKSESLILSKPSSAISPPPSSRPTRLKKSEATKIFSHLYLGNKYNSSDRTSLDNLGIRYILNVVIVVL